MTPEEKESLEWILEYLCDDANDNQDFQLEVAKRVLHNLLGDGVNERYI